MIQAIDDRILFYDQIKSITALRESFINRPDLGTRLEAFEDQAKALHNSLWSIKDINYDRDEDTFTYPGGRSYRTTICEPLYTQLGSELNEAIINNALTSSAWRQFSELLCTLNHLIQLRYTVGTDIKNPKLPAAAKDFQEGRTEPIISAITSFSETIKLWTENLSAQAKDFIEHHIHKELDSIHQFYSDKIPMFKHNFKTMFGFDHNADGSKRVKAIKVPSSQSTINSQPTRLPLRIQPQAIKLDNNKYVIKIDTCGEVGYFPAKLKKKLGNGQAQFTLQAGLKGNVLILDIPTTTTNQAELYSMRRRVHS